MTIRRAALYLGGATLLAAWFASAASMSLQSGDRPAPAPQPEALTADVPTVDVDAQIQRLKERASSEPLPLRPKRNPFAFQYARPARPADVRRVQAATLALPGPVPVDPGLTLIGIAGERRGADIARTAMIATDAGELLMAVPGDTILGRYRVAAVTSNAIELVDDTTGATKRMVLQ